MSSTWYVIKLASSTKTNLIGISCLSQSLPLTNQPILNYLWPRGRSLSGARVWTNYDNNSRLNHSRDPCCYMHQKGIHARHGGGDSMYPSENDIAGTNTCQDVSYSSDSIPGHATHSADWRWAAGKHIDEGRDVAFCHICACLYHHIYCFCCPVRFQFRKGTQAATARPRHK